MLPIVSKPILERVFDAVIDAGITEIVVVVGYRRNRIQSYFGATYRDVPITYAVQDHQLGTGHALLAAKSVLDDPCLVVNGDQIVGVDIIEEVLEAHESGDVAATLGLLNRLEIGPYGGVLLDDGRVTEIVDNPRDERNYRLNAGVYGFDSRIFDAIESTTSRAGEHSLTDAVRHLIEDSRPVRGVVSSDLWVDVKYPWDLLHATRSLIDHEGVRERETVDSSAVVHETAVVSPSAVIEAGCEVGPGAVIGPNVSLNRNVVVEANAVIEHGLVDMDARIRQNATVIDSVIGQGARVGAGTVIPGGPGDVQVDDRVYADVQLGAVLADRVRDHGGTTYAPGAVVGAGAHVHAGAVVRGTIKENREVQP